MTPALAVLVALSTAAAPSVTRGPKGNINGVELGATDLSLEKSGYPKPDASGWTSKDRMRVRVEKGVVVQVAYALVRDELDALAGTKDATLEDLAAKLGRCGPVDAREGGNWLECADNLALAETMSGVEVRVMSSTTPPKELCDAYVPAGRKVTVKAKTSYCVGSALIRADSTARDFEKDNRFGMCDPVQQGADLLRRCNGLHFTFTGPKKQLSAIANQVR